MKFRTAVWAGAGFLVSGFWALYFFPTAANTIANQPAVWALARFSCPVVFASQLGFGISVSGALVANVITYALIGVLVETVRRRIQASA